MSPRQYTKVYPVTFNGINYRSATEGKWAVFLEELQIPHVYEPEGYRLPSQSYKPDFLLLEQNVFIEIKPSLPTEDEEQKAEELARVTGQDVFIFYGPPLIAKNGGIGYNPHGYRDEQYFFCECPTCGKIEVVMYGLINELSCRCSTEGDPGNKSKNLVEAATKALRYQFSNWSPRNNNA